MNRQDQMVQFSQLYPDSYTQIVTEQGESKPRRRRKKNKGGEASELAKKRKLSNEQVNLLEYYFCNEHKLESQRKDRLASELGLEPRQVAVWFQNRRARWKNQKLEEQYSGLKREHETVLIEKCQLESEVLKLKEQLSEAEKEVQRLSQNVETVPTNSTSSSPSVETMAEPFLGEFEMEGYNEAFYTPAFCYAHAMDWFNQYI